MGLQGTCPNRWVRGCGGWQRWLWGDLAKVWIQSLGLAGSQLQVQVAPVLPRPCGGATARLPAPDSPLLEGGVCLVPQVSLGLFGGKGVRFPYDGCPPSLEGVRGRETGD